MQTQMLWEVFRETGAPEAYLLYRRSQRLDHTDGTEEEQTACI